MSSLNRFTKIASIVKTVNMNTAGDGRTTFSYQVSRLDVINLNYHRNRLQPIMPQEQSFIQQLVDAQSKEYTKFCQTHDFHEECTFSTRLFSVSWTYHLGNELVMGPFTAAPIEQLIFHCEQPPPSYDQCLIVTPSNELPSKLSDITRTFTNVHWINYERSSQNSSTCES